MPRRETEFAKIEVDFIFDDHRFNEMNGASQLAYIRLWCYCVKMRRDWFSWCKNTAWSLSKLLRTNYRSTVNLLQECCKNALLEMPDEHTLVVPGVRDKHKALSGWCVPFGNETGHNREIEEEKEVQEGRGASNSEAAEEAGGEAEAVNRAPYKKLQGEWNEMAGKCGLARAERLGSDRKKAIRARWAEEGWSDDYRKALDAIPSRPFLLGQNDRGWKADFDFFLRPGKVTKILEGAYVDGQRAKAKGHQLTLTETQARRASNGS